MKVLYVTNKPIYPIVDGGCFAMDSFMHSLLSFSSVKNISIATHKHPFNLNQFPTEIISQISPEGFFINTKFRLIHFIISIFQNKSYNVSRFYNKSFLNKIKQEINLNTYDCIILESSYLLVYLEEIKKIFNGKVILRAPNVEYKIWEDYARFSSSIIKKIGYNYLAKQLKKFEVRATTNSDKILAITENDKFQFIADGNKFVDVIPFGITSTSNNLPEINKNKIFFLGAYNWKPNLDAAFYLVKEILPELLNKFPTIELHIAGTYTPKSLYELASKNVFIHGKVESSKDFILNNGILVAPIFSGSGVRIKILEALSVGIPVVASTIATQGISNKSVLLANNKNEFIEQIIRLLSQNDLIKSIQKNALETIQNEFSIKQISFSLKKSLNVE